MTGLIDAALEISRERREILMKLREALDSGDESRALGLARQLCGLDDEKGNRTHPRLN